MKLRYQLLLISLLLLVLPWSVWQYLKGFDRALRESQTQALLDYVVLVANRLSAAPDFFAAPFVEARFIEVPFVEEHKKNTVKGNSIPDQNLSGQSQVLYSYVIPSPQIIDGYKDDWRYYDFSPLMLESNTSKVSFQSAFLRNKTFFFIDVEDDSVNYYSPILGSEGGYDRLLFRIPTGKLKQQVYSLHASAPGNVVAQYKNSDNQWRQQNAIKGVWRENAKGYQLELSIDSELLVNGFDFLVMDGDETKIGDKGNNPVANPSSAKMWDALSIVRPSLELQEFISGFSSSDISLTVLNKKQWLVASVQAKPALASRAPWFLEWLYRKMLESERLPSRELSSRRSRLNYQEVEQSLVDGGSLSWYRLESQSSKNKTLVSIAAPVIFKGNVLGYVLLEKTTDQLIALTSEAFVQLFVYSIGAFCLVLILLLFYSGWLSMRVTRLQKAAAGILTDKGDMNMDSLSWPDLNSNDELGDLSRGYKKLLFRVQEYNHYLRTLSGKLSHELRTPIAVVRSSLENLKEVGDANSKEDYLNRAQQGLARLNGILNAMSAANHIEESINSVSAEDFKRIDMVRFLKDMSVAYQDSYSSNDFLFLCEKEEAFCRVAPDLFVQMLDKLIDNAVGFTRKDKAIEMVLRSEKNTIAISIGNDGPLLPEDWGDRLFESMVSLRNQSEGGASSNSHLGLGLYIVRLVADVHGADVTALNKEDGSGVEFIIRVPLAE